MHVGLLPEVDDNYYTNTVQPQLSGLVRTSVIVWIIKSPDNRGPDNRGSTVTCIVHFRHRPRGVA